MGTDTPSVYPVPLRGGTFNPVPARICERWPWLADGVVPVNTAESGPACAGKGIGACGIPSDVLCPWKVPSESGGSWKVPVEVEALLFVSEEGSNRCISCLIIALEATIVLST